MKIIKMLCFSTIALSFLNTVNAKANTVILKSKKPIKVVFQIAHKNMNGPVVLEAKQTLQVNNSTQINFNLRPFARAGVTIYSINGHILPASINQFDQPRQCSMTTNKSHANGILQFNLTKHRLTCATFGGIYGG